MLAALDDGKGVDDIVKEKATELGLIEEALANVMEAVKEVDVLNEASADLQKAKEAGA